MTTKAQQWIHGAHIITMTDGGSFRCTLSGDTVLIAPSLDAMKKKLDKRAVFKPFRALTRSGNERFNSISIVGTRKNPRKHTNYPNVFVTESGVTHERVTLDTPENRKLMDEHRALIAKNDEIRNAMKAVENAIAAKIKRLSVPEYNGLEPIKG